MFNFISFLFFLFFIYLIGMILYISFPEFSQLKFIKNIFYDSYSFIPIDDKYLIILIFIGLLFLFSFYYSLFKKLSPRWRVYSANKIIFKIRKTSSEYSHPQILSYLRTIDPFVFEEMLLSLFHERGCRIKRNKKYTGDGGSDGIFWYKGNKFHIQAKRYKSYIIKSHVESFNDLIAKDSCKGVFIHTGKTGKGSMSILKENSISFISGEKLIDFVIGKDIFIFGDNISTIRKIKNK